MLMFHPGSDCFHILEVEWSKEPRPSIYAREKYKTEN